MIVAVAYQFHDHEPTMFLVETALLGDTVFAQDVKAALETDQGVGCCFHYLDGNKYNDQWGGLEQAKVPPPRMVEACRILKVDFEG